MLLAALASVTGTSAPTSSPTTGVTVLKFDGTINHVGTGHNGGQFQIQGDFSGADVSLLNSVTVEVKALMRDDNAGATELLSEHLPFTMHPDRIEDRDARGAIFKSARLANRQEARMDLSTKDITDGSNFHFKFRADREVVGTPVCTDAPGGRGKVAHLGFDFLFTVHQHPPSPPPSPPARPPHPPSPPKPPAAPGGRYPTAHPTAYPTPHPSAGGTISPTGSPTVSSFPTAYPTAAPILSSDYPMHFSLQGTATWDCKYHGHGPDAIVESLKVA